MAERSFGAKSGGRVQLDVCQGCGGLWFDTNESLQLSAGGTLLLFRAVYGEREAYHPRRDGPMSCPRCDEKLVLVHDLAHSNRFQSWRCGQGHGHFITFFQFLREKGLVRALHPKELTELRKHVDTLLCSDCGEPIRLANRSSCARCHAPLSLMDPECVETTIRDAQEAAGSRRDVAPHVAAQLVMTNLGMKYFRPTGAIAAPVGILPAEASSSEGRDLVSTGGWDIVTGVIDLLGDILSLH